MFIKGITVTLHERTQSLDKTGNPIFDGFNKPIFEENPIEVENVLVSPVEDKDVIDAINLYGKKAVYELCIPKGDTHNWEDSTVEFFGKKFKTFGVGKEYIEDMVPLAWNKKIKVEIYE